MTAKKENLILFVHGFIGKKRTWDNNLKNDFVGLLKEDSIIYNNFDFAIFEYYTTFTNIPSSQGFPHRLPLSPQVKDWGRCGRGYIEAGL